jgi:pyruvate formate lyase activating enzyme
LPYHHVGVEKYKRLDRVYRLPEARPPSNGRMAELAQVLREFDLPVKIGG